MRELNGCELGSVSGGLLDELLSATGFNGGDGGGGGGAWDMDVPYRAAQDCTIFDFGFICVEPNPPAWDFPERCYDGAAVCV
jgi:hypothetical protein